MCIRDRLFSRRSRNIFTGQITTGDIETDNSRRQRSAVTDTGMNLVGDVAGMVAGAYNEHLTSGGRNRIRCETLARNFVQRYRILTEIDDIKRELFGCAAARVNVDLKIDQLIDG